MNPLQAIPQAEQQLTAALSAAADALDTVGKHRLDSAVNRFRSSAVAAQNRLLDIKSMLILDVQHTLDLIGDIGREFLEHIPCYDRPQLESIKTLPFGPDEMVDLAGNVIKLPEYHPENIPFEDEVIDLNVDVKAETEKQKKSRKRK